MNKDDFEKVEELLRSAEGIDELIDVIHNMTEIEGVQFYFTSVVAIMAFANTKDPKNDEHAHVINLCQDVIKSIANYV